MEDPILVDNNTSNNIEDGLLEKQVQPELNEVSEQKLSSLGFGINIVKSAAGISVLAIPYGVYQFGILLSVFFYVLFAFAYNYASYLFLYLYNEYEKGNIKEDNTLRLKSPFLHIVHAFTGKFGYYVVLISITGTLYGACVNTIVVCTDLLVSLPWNEWNIIIDTQYLRIIICAVLTILSIILTLLKHPNQLVFMSVTGIVCLLLSLLLLFINGITTYGFSFSIDMLYPKSLFGVFSNLGIFLYTLSFFLILVPLYKNVKTEAKQNIMVSLNISITVLVCTFSFIGIGLYSLYSGDEKGVQSNIMLNLDSHSWMTIFINVAMVITCLGSYPLLMLGALEIVESNIENPKEGKIFVSDSKRIWGRILQVCLISIVSLIIPFFNIIINVIGGFLNLIVSLLASPILYIVYQKTKDPISIYKKIFLYIFIAFFSVIMVICTTSSIMNLITELKRYF